jgi:hypothetical protein
MPNLNDLTALCLLTGSRLAADETQIHLSLRLEGQPLLTLRLMRGPELHVQLEEHFGRPSAASITASARCSGNCRSRGSGIH